MPSYLNELAKDLLEDHKGIPNAHVAEEVVEAFLRVIRKKIIKEGTVYLENIGKLEVKKFAGTVKRTPAGVKYNTSSRNVLKFHCAPSLSKMINMARTPVERVRE